MAQKITKQSEDFNRWYTDVVLQAELADYSPVKGCMVIRPNGYAIWEKMQTVLDRMFKETGHENAYFPLFIPEHLLHREEEHVEGFAPECAVVTHGGGKQLEEPLIVRPTSETIIYEMYKKWIKSYRDLPVLINQWVNVVRWEMRTRLFLRTTEFLWQEGHTAHETYEEAEEETLKILEIYSDFYENYLAIPVLKGVKSESERFAGALKTYCIESMMRDKKALQSGTSHNLGQNFAKAFNVQFQDRSGKMDYVWQTSWGVSTRMIGAVIMAHGDDKGLRIPPKIASCQIVLIPIWKTDEQRKNVGDAVDRIVKILKKHAAVKVDDRENYSPGWKFNQYELLGVPLRLELGPKDVGSKSVFAARRDTGEKFPISWNDLEKRIPELLDEIQHSLFEQALQFREKNTFIVDDYDEFKEQNEKEGGFFAMHWCGSDQCENRMKEDTKATIRLIPMGNNNEEGACILCGRKSNTRIIAAKAY
ncbi:proline--tRNA ligase [candidate division KSB1 bacterium]